MKVVVRNPSLPVLVAGILLGLAVRKEVRLQERRTNPNSRSVEEGTVPPQKLRNIRSGERMSLPAPGAGTPRVF